MSKNNTEDRDFVAGDTELYRKFLTGDVADQRAFIHRWETPMFNIAFRIVGQSADAEEVRQTVLLKMLERSDVLPNPNRIGSWLRRCVVNESISLLRKRKRHASLDNIDESVAPHGSRSADDARFLQELLGQMEPSTRALLALRFDENLTVRQIADIVEEPRSTVHAKLQSAIECLRRQFNPAKQGVTK